MRIRYYVQTKELGNGKYVYGYQSMINDKPFDNDCGITSGDKKVDVIEMVTQHIIRKNGFNKLPTSIQFKYEDLNITKHMLALFKDRKYAEWAYKQHVSLDASPSVFLSDNEHVVNLNKKMDYHIDMTKLNRFQGNER